MARLSREQMKASRSDGGVTLVIAGAGTGKTKTLIAKLTAIISRDKIPPENILVLTFSRKAAEEIRNRVQEEIGASALGLPAETFHSFSLSLLRSHSDIFMPLIGYDTFPSILDESDRGGMIRDIVLSNIDDFLGIPAEVVSRLIDDLDRIDGKGIARLAEHGLLEKIRSARNVFRRTKIRRGCMDFQDMISHAILLLDKYESLVQAVRDRYRYILVDEFQDTSPENFKLLRHLLPEKDANLFVVGDDWQSIYGFRDSRIEYIVSMRRYFPEAEIHRLTVNYRSRHEIVELSNRFIKRNKYRTNKRLRSFKGRGGAVYRHVVNTRDQENSIITSILSNSEGGSESTVILYRNNWQGRHIAMHLEKMLPSTVLENLALMTIHSSKGLEFDTVILAGIADAIIPDPGSEIEEERRLLYVALTRARESLHLICHSGKDGSLPRFAQELGRV
ncbi:MAG TPA: ATP-dependent helicase [Spirochaetota bacterium]|nr:ATP-dependent helicase [Spirochaetota bacterium]